MKRTEDRIKKRLIVCCDGTWQKLDSKYPTNVVKIAQAIKPAGRGDIPQIVFYDEGVGTGDVFDGLFDGAFGWGIDQNIQDAYRFLSLNYEDGDEIYLYGFSRGAYTVRSLAGLIKCCGLLKRNQIRLAGRAYALYRDEDIKPKSREAIDFRQQYSHVNDQNDNVRIKLLGCWDTVGALGIPDQVPWLNIDKFINKKYQFHDTFLSSIIDNARHAVSIDEMRKVFDVTIMQKSPSNKFQNLKQVWFAGNHGCVGGGEEQNRGLSDISLSWMIDESQALGIEFDLSKIIPKLNPNHKIPFDNEVKGIFKNTGVHLRRVDENEIYLHPSVKNRWLDLGEFYRPKNLIMHQKYLSSEELCS
ncbi:MAG: DUF2235 domain-containing protein [Cyanobacteria bacterium P01_G01_bin.39]